MSEGWAWHLGGVPSEFPRRFILTIVSQIITIITKLTRIPKE